MVIVGKAASIYIPELPPVSTGAGRLRGLRLLHTHLGHEGLDQEDLMDLLFLRLDAVHALTVNEAGEPDRLQTAWLVPLTGQRAQSDAEALPYIVDRQKAWHLAECDLESIRGSFEKIPFDNSPGRKASSGMERAFLLSVSTLPQLVQERNLDELEKLAETAGLQVAGRLTQRVQTVNPKFILGKGKLAELEVEALKADAGILIFDGELSPGQLHNLADITERKVLDRTQLILDIFAQHAVSRAGKLQVELAQLAYVQPRLAGQNKALDRLMGGIGGRGPGESRLETDRRKNRERIAFLKKELARLRRQRSLVRTRRVKNRIPVAAIVGYTNAGKSTLLNTLTSSATITANKLFATLDPVTRRLRFPKEREITLADTVGFIRNLPEDLKEAFRATLEELDSADLLLHVVDAGHADQIQQMEAVKSILAELGLAEMPTVLIFNKCDLLPPDAMIELQQAHPAALFVSAQTGQGLDTLLERLEQELFMRKHTFLPDMAIRQ